MPIDTKKFSLGKAIGTDTFQIIDNQMKNIHFTVFGLKKNAAEQLVDIINNAMAGIPETEKTMAIKNEEEVKLWRKNYTALFGVDVRQKDIINCFGSTLKKLNFLESKNKQLQEQIETADEALLKLEGYRQQAVKELSDIREFIGANPEESTYDEVVRMKSLLEKEKDSDHNRMRKQLWAETTVRAVGNGTLFRSSTDILETSDEMLAGFDERFGKTQTEKP